MLEGVLERLLLDRLGEYVDLPKDSIQIGVWSGEIILDNVTLRPSCLTRLKLPVDVSLGKLRKMHIKVPWSSLGSSPVKVFLNAEILRNLKDVPLDYFRRIVNSCQARPWRRL